MAQTHDTQAGYYYASARNDAGHYVLLDGPYDTHQEAHDALGPAKAMALAVDPRAPWYAYGTARRDLDEPLLVGVLNKQGLLPATKRALDLGWNAPRKEGAA